MTKKTPHKNEETESDDRPAWAKSGWDDADDYTSDDTGHGLSFTRFFSVDPGRTKRILFLDDIGFAFYEHDTYNLTRRGDRVVCLRKNSLDERGCPYCEADLWAYFIGYASVIDMGYVEIDGEDVTLEGTVSKKDDNVIYQFDRKLYGAKRGSQEKPGMLPKLKRLAQKHGGSLVGTVWDCYRSGKKASKIGDEMEFVEKVAPADFEAYLLEIGAKKDKLKDNLVPFKYMDEFKPLTFEEMQRTVSGNGGKAQRRDDFDDDKKPARSGKVRTSGASY
jgi:hypothetical protein